MLTATHLIAVRGSGWKKVILPFYWLIYLPLPPIEKLWQVWRICLVVYAAWLLQSRRLCSQVIEVVEARLGPVGEIPLNSASSLRFQLSAF